MISNSKIILSAVVLLAVANVFLPAQFSQASNKPVSSKQDLGLLRRLLDTPVVSGALVSPDGKAVVWNYFHAGPVINVYTMSTKSDELLRALTMCRENTWVVSWCPDNKSVIVAQDTGGDERVRLYRVYLSKPNELQLLTDANPNYYIDGGYLLPDERFLLYSANYDFSNKKETEESWLYIHDLKDGSKRVLSRSKKGGGMSPIPNKQGSRVLYAKNDLHPAGRQLYLVDFDGRNDREILNFGADKKVYGCFFPDGERVLFLAEAGTHNKVGVFDCKSGAIKWLIDDPNRNIESVHFPENANRFVLNEYKEAKLHSSFVDPSTGAEQAVAALGQSVEPIAPSDDPNLWVCSAYSSNKPEELVLYDCQKNIAHTLSRLQNSPITAKLKTAEDFRWTAGDGQKIHGFLYRASLPKGTIVLVHGGPTGHDQDEFDPQIQYFVASGFNVLCPNYRGSTGYGLQFQESIKKEGWGGSEQDDIRRGIEALIKEGIASPGKIGITGTSYGGYSTWWAITHFPKNLIAAAAPICGMTDLVVDYETTRPDLRPYSEEMMGGSPQSVPTRYKERSPINFVNKIEGKLLIVQGARDPNVTPKNVQAVESELRKFHIPYQKLVFADEGHGIERSENELRLYRRLVDFFTAAFRI